MTDLAEGIVPQYAVLRVTVHGVHWEDGSVAEVLAL